MQIGGGGARPVNKSRLIGGGALALAALAFVGAWEGRSLRAYLDGGGVPTICNGSTAGVRLGQVATPAECDAMFMADMVRHETMMRKCLRAPDALPDKTYIAFLSFTYNVGGGAACGSSVFRLANAGDLRGACNRLPLWNKDNGRVVRGLTNRRASERAICLEGAK